MLPKDPLAEMRVVSSRLPSTLPFFPSLPHFRRMSIVLFPDPVEPVFAALRARRANDPATDATTCPPGDNLGNLLQEVLRIQVGLGSATSGFHGCVSVRMRVLCGA